MFLYAHLRTERISFTAAIPLFANKTLWIGQFPPCSWTKFWNAYKILLQRNHVRKLTCSEYSMSFLYFFRFLRILQAFHSATSLIFSKIRIISFERNHKRRRLFQKIEKLQFKRNELFNKTNLTRPWIDNQQNVLCFGVNLSKFVISF